MHAVSPDTGKRKSEDRFVTAAVRVSKKSQSLHLKCRFLRSRVALLHSLNFQKQAITEQFQNEREMIVIVASIESRSPSTTKAIVFPRQQPRSDHPLTMIS